MTLNEIAVQYRDSAKLLRDRIRALTAQLAENPCGEMEKLRLRRRIDILRTLYNDTNCTAVFLEKYYDKGYRANARFKI